jgi:ribonuclease R
VYMSENVGKVFKGIVSSVTEYGIFVEILENKCDCLVKLSSIKGTWQAKLEKHSIIEFNTGATIRLGDSVHVIIDSVDIERKNINASIIVF